MKTTVEFAEEGVALVGSVPTCEACGCAEVSWADCDKCDPELWCFQTECDTPLGCGAIARDCEDSTKEREDA